MNSLVETQLKICVVSISLAKGGAERSTAILTKMLKSEGHEVHLVLLNNAIDYEFEGKLFNLGLEKKGLETPDKRFRRIHKLRQFLKAKNFDFIIDTRARNAAIVEWMYLNYVYKGFKSIYIIHNGTVQKYLTEYPKIVKLIVEKTYKIVGVSKYISELINSKYNTKKAITIYNSFDVPEEANIKNEKTERYILFLGRFDEHHKNLSLLIEAYQKSKLSNHNVKLYLVGDGEDKELIRKKINSLELESFIKIFPFTKTIYPLLKMPYF